jgi:CubicO group peptidase (beta-lactamase class C family)
MMGGTLRSIAVDSNSPTAQSPEGIGIMHGEDALTMTTPENVGMSSISIVRFIDRLAYKQLPVHSFIMVRHGKIAAESYAPPFHKDRLHRMYSISKSFVAAAIGLMIDEGRIALNDTIVDFFPELLPPKVHPYLSAMTVRDLLMMATPFSENTYTRHDTNWVGTFFTTPPSHPPGTIFSYNTGATVTLTALVEKLSGVPLLDYLRPRLLDPIGFSEKAWCIQRPEGGSWGGSGILCRPRDLARFALVLLKKGAWGNRQLLSEHYVIEATSKQIDNRVSSGFPELNFGYGYQIWRTRNNGFALLGMGSQFAICLPDKDFILVTTADTQAIETGYCDILDALWEEVYPYLTDEALPKNEGDHRRLIEAQSKLRLPPVSGALTSSLSTPIDGQEYILEANPMKMSRVRFSFEETTGRMEYQNESGEHCIEFGLGSYVEGKFPEENYYGERIGRIPGIRYDCMASAAWADEHSLLVYVYVVDSYIGTLKIHAVFGEREISLLMVKAAEWFLDEYQGFAGGHAAQPSS